MGILGNIFGAMAGKAGEAVGELADHALARLGAKFVVRALDWPVTLGATFLDWMLYDNKASSGPCNDYGGILLPVTMAHRLGMCQSNIA